MQKFLNKLNAFQLWLGLFAIVGSVAVALHFWPEEEDHRMIADITIYVTGLLLDNGGTIIILPKKDMEERIKWEPERTKTEVTVSAQETIVMFDYPKEGTYKFRFRAMRQSGQQHSEVMTQLVGVGHGAYRDNKTNEMVEVKDIQTIVVLGKDGGFTQSQKLRNKITSMLREDSIICEPFLNAKVCVAR